MVNLTNFSFDLFKNELENSISKEEFAIWLKDLAFVEFRDKKLTLKTTSEFKKERICHKYSQSIQAALKIQGCLSSDWDIQISEFSPEKDKQEKNSLPDADSSEKNSPAENSPSPKISSIVGEAPVRDHGIKAEFTFDNYVLCDFNKIANGFVQKVKEGLGKITPLYIYSQVGLGKTHLIHALGNYYLQAFPFLKIKCINPNDFVSEFTKSLLEKRDRQFRLKYRSLDILLLDDIQFFMGKDKSCVEFFHIFNEVYAPNKQMIFCSDRLPEELDAIDDRLKSRLSSSAIVGIEHLHQADKEKLLAFYLHKNNLDLEQKVFAFVVAHLPSDVRKIIGVVNTLTVYRDIYDRDLDIEFCRQHLKQLTFKVEGNSFSPEKLLLTIANLSKIPMGDFKTPKRSKTLSHYRQILMYLLRTHTHLSLPEIGRFLGGKTNSAILFGVKKITAELEKSRELKSTVEEILQAS